MKSKQQINSEIAKLKEELKQIEEKEKSQLDTEWTSISKTEEISKQIYNNKTYSEILTLLKKEERIANYQLLQKLRNAGKIPVEFWVFVPNPDKISVKNNYVARFFADSGRADLDCGRNPTYAGAGLGVFVVRRKVRLNKKSHSKHKTNSIK